VTVPQELLAKLPAAARGKACVCANCIRQSGAVGAHRTTDPGGREAILLRAGNGDEVLVARDGAQVLHYRRGGRDVLWTASRPEHRPAKPVRGGVPLVFPWFGDHPTDPSLPAHGFARAANWQWAAATATPSVSCVFAADATTLRLWPHRFAMRLDVTLDTALRLQWTVTNTDTQPWTAELALHSYYAVGEVTEARVHGLEGVAVTEHAAAPEANWDRAAPLRFRAETDRIFQDVPADLRLEATALGRRVDLTTAGAPSAIVWNPWPAKAARLPQMAGDDWRQFVCIETAAVRERAIRLAPGQSHRLELTIRASDCS
jgi:glucose-6-phosphate 1-epimerase